MIAMFTLDGVIGEDGQVNNFWNSGVSILIALVYIYHFTCLLELRSWNFGVFCGWAVSFIFTFPFTIKWADNSTARLGQYYKNQWPLYENPLFNFTVFLQIAIILLPTIMYKCVEHSFWHPEFSKIKGS